MTELVQETSRVPTSSPLRPGGREAVDPMEEAGAWLHVSPPVWGPKTRDVAVWSRVVPCPAGEVLAGSVAQHGQASRPRAARSDAETFFPAIDVTEPQVDICANALQ